MDINFPSEYSRQDRTNAATAYFFLAPVMLLARGNPLYMHEFVRGHAWRALRLQGLLLGYFFFWAYILSSLLSFVIPVLDVRLDRLITLGVCTVFLGLTIHSAIQAHRGITARGSGLSLGFGEIPVFASTTSLSESDIARTLLSFVPLVTYFVHARTPTVLTWVGVRFTGLVSLLIAMSLVFSRGDNAFYALVFLQTLVAVALAFHLIFRREPTFLGVLAYILSLETIMTYTRSIPGYLWDMVQMLIGKSESLSFETRLAVTRLADADFEIRLARYFTDSTSILSPYLIYIPVVNLLFLAKFLRPGTSQYVVAVGQGVILTILCILAGYFVPEYLLFALFPIAMGLANIRTRPFMRIPVLYELSVLLSTLGFGLIQGTRATRAKSAEVREVRLTVD